MQFGPGMNKNLVIEPGTKTTLHPPRVLRDKSQPVLPTKGIPGWQNSYPMCVDYAPRYRTTGGKGNLGAIKPILEPS